MSDWHRNAPCASIGGDWWFPEDNDNGHAAKKICATCPYKAPCLTEALEAGLRDGIWGGVAIGQYRRNTPNPRPQSTDTHCRNRHPWAGNERIKPNGSVVCRACQIEQSARWRTKRRVAA